MKLRAFTVHFDNGDKLSTNMNGKITDDEIRRYYIGTTFVNEDHNGVETTITGVNVDFHDNCPHFQKLDEHAPNSCPICNKTIESKE